MPGRRSVVGQRRRRAAAALPLSPSGPPSFSFVHYFHQSPSSMCKQQNIQQACGMHGCRADESSVGGEIDDTGPAAASRSFSLAL
jgi:hypothetical protein